MEQESDNSRGDHPARPHRGKGVAAQLGEVPDQQNIDDALDRAFDEGLTGHVITAREGKRVQLQDGTEAVELVSCSYLKLRPPDLVAAATEALHRFGVHFSTSRNRGRPHYLGELEDLLSCMYGGASAVAFTSVSNIHLGLLPLLGAGALPSYPVAPAGATFLVERTAHASMQVLRGLLEQVGPVQRFDITDPEALPGAAREIAAGGRTPIALVDGVGSMGGPSAWRTCTHNWNRSAATFTWTTHMASRFTGRSVLATPSRRSAASCPPTWSWPDRCPRRSAARAGSL